MEIEIENIIQNKDQPRKFFDESSLNELADSIKKHGLLENLVVRPQNDAKTISKGKYELVCGERRHRACKIGGVTMVTTNVREMSDKEAYELSLTENIQRDNLTPIEEAMAYEKLKQFSSQGEISKTVHKSRTRVNQMLQLLELPEEIYPFFSPFYGIKPLTERHGRELLRFKRFLDKCVKAKTNGCYHVFEDDYYKDNWDSKAYTDFFKIYCCERKHKHIKGCVLYDIAQGAFFTGVSFKKFVDTINWFMYDIIRAKMSFHKKISDEDRESMLSSIHDEYMTMVEKMEKEDKKKLEWWRLQKSMKPVSHEFIPNNNEYKFLEPRSSRENRYRIRQLSYDDWIRTYGIDKDGIDHDIMIWFMQWAKEHGMRKDGTNYEED